MAAELDDVEGCPFCDFGERDVLWSDDLAFAFRDAYPVSEGHTLVVPRRHVATYFEATPWEHASIWRGVEAVKKQLDAELSPDGYNVGFNAGEAAGQTVMHLHVHVIPRFRGDVPDPEGGVRGVIPSKQKYRTAPANDDDDDDGSGSSENPFSKLSSFVHGEEHHFGVVLREALALADEIDLASAFVQKSGLAAIEGALRDALDRGAKVRVLTGDYLNITHPHALQELYTLSTLYDDLQVRLYRVGARQSFHLKAYIFLRGPHGAAFVGSSNLSHTALTHGIEWNLRTTERDAATVRALRERFERLFLADAATPLSRAVLDDYRQRIRFQPAPEKPEPPPEPHGVQTEVLKRLAQTREDGHGRGLVVMATGLGKTYLSAFDFAQLAGKRALFVAHREEILEQAAETWGRVLPDRSRGFLHGRQKEPDAEVLFASVQTLSLHRHLRGFAPDHFDYVVIDEFHHASANSYRKLLGHFRPRFLLGLTATPNRMDGAALLDLCEDNEVARVGLFEGIRRELLCPFHYFGVRDELDFAPIPWRSGRFDPAALEAAANTESRASQALREYRAKATAEPRRALVFCCSRRHADFMAAYLTDHGVPAASVHSGAGSDPRAESLERLREGDLEAICAVDVFNEGVDLPDVNTILMLRPTESPVIFQQQLGRGLRRSSNDGHKRLTVIDFIGNHRSFMVKPQALVALTGRDTAPGAALREIRQGLDLPEGCEVEIETQALEMLERVANLSKDDRLQYAYRQLHDSLGHRPSARELYASGVDPRKPLKDRYGTWFDFLAAMGDLTDTEAAILDEYRPWFEDLHRTQMSRSYKMIALEALDELDALHDTIAVDDLARRCHERLARDPVLHAELAEHREAGGDLADFTRRWRQMPLGIFHSAKGFQQRWFRLEGDRFISLLDVDDEHRETFDAMTAELVELRLEIHTSNKRYADTVIPFTAPIALKVGHRQGSPRLLLDRERRPDTPTGRVEVDVDGEAWFLDFGTTSVDAAAREPGGPNVLPMALQRWFGPIAGLPGTGHWVELVPSPGNRWNLRARDREAGYGDVIPLNRVDYYPDLRVACGVPAPQPTDADTQDALSIAAGRPVDPKRHFVVRADGDSMDGGAMPIRDGDLVLCEWATVSDPAQVEGRPVLLTGGTADETLAFLKIPVRVDGRWVLRSTNPDVPDRPVDPGATLRVVALVREVVEERRDPILWGLYDRDAIAGCFGHTNDPSWRSGHRDIDVDGQPHTVLMVNLRKPKGTPEEQRYSDRFLAPDEFQWESQASTTPEGAKGRRILHHADEGRTVHLFVRYRTKNAEQKAEPYTYLGPVTTLRHEGSKPIRVWFRLETPLPEKLWQTWRTA
ncbi:MAG: DUF3427 domain-containing protein [Myxococcota bacterium]